ncbi:MAG: DNA repair protein RecO [Proteobacteria bacterium]|nr:DNA repair protein RecO [Pseudomonadota bacterium]
MGLHKDEAIILSKRAYGESDKIMRLFTLISGKISAIAKGAGKSQKRFMNTLEPFNHINVEYFEKQARGMVRIENADIIETGSGMETSLKKVSVAAFFVEFADRLTKEREKNTALFYILKDILARLKYNEFDYEDILHQELKILEILGYMPNFIGCVYCGKFITDDHKVHFSSERGGILCPACSRAIPHRTYSGGTIPRLISIGNNGNSSAFEVRDSKGPSDVYIPDETKRFEREVMEIMESFISFHLDVEFKSYKILKSLI